MGLDEYDYPLPPELIAQEPIGERDRSRLLVLGPKDALHHREFRDLPGYFSPGDLLVVNETRVFPARLMGKKEDTGAEVELLLLRAGTDGTWETLARPAKRLRCGGVIIFGDDILRAEVVEKGEYGRVRVMLSSSLDINEAVDRVGRIPLPHYIRREPDAADCERYQTIYARVRGAVAAPTAGLHFTPSILDTLVRKGVKTATVTLHVGIGTFRPLTEEDVEKDTLHSEYCLVPGETADAVHAARAAGGRVFAVGTTTVRALETASRTGEIGAFEGFTDLFIRPGYSFHSIDALITNFHLPRSSLLMLVSAFTGRERVLEAYRVAVRERYRFYSYGDAMLITARI